MGTAMKKPKPQVTAKQDSGQLFRKTAPTSHRPLILPLYLNEEAAKPINQGPGVEAAQKILVRWADLESNGHLAKKETSLDEAFRQEVIGQALRYSSSTTSPSSYQYEKSFFIPGIGTPDGVLGNFSPSRLDPYAQ